MDIFSLLNNDISGLSEEERRIAEKFNEDLRKKIIDDLANCEINEIINEGAVVLTRAWAAAFDYIQNIEESQAAILKKIYNSFL